MKAEICNSTSSFMSWQNPVSVPGKIQKSCIGAVLSRVIVELVWQKGSSEERDAILPFVRKSDQEINVQLPNCTEIKTKKNQKKAPQKLNKQTKNQPTSQPDKQKERRSYSTHI